MIILPMYGGITIFWCVLIVSFALPPFLKQFPQKKSEKRTRNKSALVSAIITFVLYISIILYRTITVLSNSWAKNDPMQAWRANVSWVAVLLLPIAILLFFILWGITTKLVNEKEVS
jgi:magnesium-transporting ATPase (P-type)